MCWRFCQNCFSWVILVLPMRSAIKSWLSNANVATAQLLTIKSYYVFFTKREIHDFCLTPTVWNHWGVGIIRILLLTAHCNIKPPEANTVMYALSIPNSFKVSIFTPSQEVPISLKSFLMTSSHPNKGGVCFCLADKDSIWSVLWINIACASKTIIFASFVTEECWVAEKGTEKD